MTTEQITFDKVNSRIYFKDKTRKPMFGYFTKLHDAEELSVKKLARFVKTENFENFEETGLSHYTHILSLPTIAQVKIFEYGTS